MERGELVRPRRSARIAQRRQQEQREQLLARIAERRQAQLDEMRQLGLLRHINDEEQEEEEEEEEVEPVPIRRLPNQEYGEGAIVWGRLGKSPYMPARVAIEPASGQYYKIKICRNGVVRQFYHLEWLGDGRTSWLGASALAPFEIEGGRPHRNLKAYIINEANTKVNKKAARLPPLGSRLREVFQRAVEVAAVAIIIM